MSALIAGRELQGLPVFGHGSAGQGDAIRAQDIHNVLVAERVVRVLVFDQSGDHCFQRLLRVIATSPAGEEVGRGEEPLSALDVLVAWVP